MKEIFKLSKEEFNNKIGETIYERLMNLLKVVMAFITIWFTLELFMGHDELINSYPFVLWLLAGLVPASYMISVLFDSIKHKDDKPFTVINIANFMLFSILLFIQIVIFRIFGFEIDMYYIQIPGFMILTFIFMELCSVILINIGKINKRINDFLGVCILPLFAFSGILFQYSGVHNGYLKKCLNIDPVYYLVNGFRNCFVYKKWFYEEPKRFAYFASICLFMLVVAFMLNRINKKK